MEKVVALQKTKLGVGQIYRRALLETEKALGEDHKSTLTTVNDLRLLYAEQASLDKTEQMYRRALAGCGKMLGEDHTSTLDTATNLANLYRNQGRLVGAEWLYRHEELVTIESPPLPPGTKLRSSSRTTPPAKFRGRSGRHLSRRLKARVERDKSCHAWNRQGVPSRSF